MGVIGLPTNTIPCRSSADCSSDDECDQGSCVPSFHSHGGCFSGNDEVRLATNVTKSMHALEVGDQIWAICKQDTLCLTPVIRIPHAEAHMPFVFYTVETQDAYRISLSDNHYVRVHEHGYLSGGELSFSHSLYIVDANGTLNVSPISIIKRELKYGVYQPVTLAGTLLVNDIVASSYLNNLKLSHEQLHRILTPLHWWYYLTQPFGIRIHRAKINKIFVHWAQRRLIWYRNYLPWTCEILAGLLTIFLCITLMRTVK